MISNTHLLGELMNITGSPLKDQRLADIQNVADDKYYHANGNESVNEPQQETEDTKQPENQPVDTTEQAKDVAAKEHAKQEPAKIFGVNVWYIVGGIAVIGGGYWAYTKYFKK